MLFLTAIEMGRLRTTESVVIRLFVEFAEELVPYVVLFTSVPILGLVGLPGALSRGCPLLAQSAHSLVHCTCPPRA
jgi:hypothetical protein